MNVIHGYDHVPLNARGSVLAIGNFDGVHRGHQALLDRVVERAGELHAVPAVMIFEPHPREFFHPEEPHFRLTPLNEKLRLLDRSGIKVAVVVPFNAQLAAMGAAEFIERVLVAGLGVRHVVIGYDFFFGNRRSGTPETMRLAGEELGFGVSVVAPVAEGGEVFSSTAIRLKLVQGDVRGAADALGHWWRVSGEVVGGARRGAGLGFPTANLALPPGTALAHGIYAVRAFVGGRPHEGAAYLGTRPTFDNGKPILEVFLFDFDGDLYGRTMDVDFVDFIRADRRFDTSEALQRQMREDCDKSRQILAAAPSPLSQNAL
jgi:riboflavin kinase / FMN adenylyltransferase